MRHRCCALVLLLEVSVFAGSSAGQLDSGGRIPRVRVQVALTNARCDAAIHVTLVGRGGPFGDATADGQCEAGFLNVPAGTYHLLVSGQNIPDTDSGPIELTPTADAELEVRVKRSAEPERNYSVPASALVSAADLGIPARAQKEVEKANLLLAKQDLTHALEKLKKAIAIYPDFAEAYNNLGVIYAQLGDHEHESEALRRAVRINDRFALAHVNLGRMELKAGDFSSAETELNKAFLYDPSQPMTLVLLAYTELMERRFDDVIATSWKAHALDKPHAVVHRLAANALEQEGQAAGAIVELELFLAEEPTGSRADAARKELADVRAVPH